MRVCVRTHNYAYVRLGNTCVAVCMHIYIYADVCLCVWMCVCSCVCVCQEGLRCDTDSADDVQKILPVIYYLFVVAHFPSHCIV